MVKRKNWPMITSLKENEIIIVGTNKLGQHLGGAARQAYSDFGLKWGCGEGLSGQTYAFPTLDENFRQVSLNDLRRSRDRLYEVVESMPDKVFLLTSVGTGIAGFELEVIKELFKDTPKNIKSWKHLKK